MLAPLTLLMPALGAGPGPAAAGPPWPTLLVVAIPALSYFLRASNWSPWEVGCCCPRLAWSSRALPGP